MSARKLWTVVKSFCPKRVFTDELKSYRGIIPRRKHIASKRFTQAVEAINGTIRHFLARFRRKTKCTSKSKFMAEETLALFMNKSILLEQCLAKLMAKMPWNR